LAFVLYQSTLEKKGSIFRHKNSVHKDIRSNIACFWAI
jgi:hypothetical protein